MVAIAPRTKASPFSAPRSASPKATRRVKTNARTTAPAPKAGCPDTAPNAVSSSPQFQPRSPTESPSATIHVSPAAPASASKPPRRPGDRRMRSSAARTRSASSGQSCQRPVAAWTIPGQRSRLPGITAIHSKPKKPERTLYQGSAASAASAAAKATSSLRSSRFDMVAGAGREVP